MSEESEEPEEQKLEGGQLTRVVRIGDTVHRGTGPWTPAVHALLGHLERVGFRAAPRVLGLDADAREVLTYIPGKTAGSLPWPSWVYSEDVLAAVGRWLRNYHEVVRDFQEPGGAQWRMHWSPQADDEVICHFDVAPYNLVLRDDGEVSLIDWDVAAPGSPRLELAKVANSFATLYDGDQSAVASSAGLSFGPAMQARVIHRVRVLLDAYELDDRAGFIDNMLDASAHSCERISRGAAEGDVALQRLVTAGTVMRLRKDRRQLLAWRQTLAAGIET